MFQFCQFQNNQKFFHWQTDWQTERQTDKSNYRSSPLKPDKNMECMLLCYSLTLLYFPIYLRIWPDQGFSKNIYGQTDRPRDRQTDNPTYRKSFTELKKCKKKCQQCRNRQKFKNFKNVKWHLLSIRIRIIRT